MVALAAPAFDSRAIARVVSKARRDLLCRRYRVGRSHEKRPPLEWGGRFSLAIGEKTRRTTVTRFLIPSIKAGVIARARIVKFVKTTAMKLIADRN